jgi:hypothetical protein
MAMTGKTPRKTLPPGIAKVLKRLHYPLDVILLCVRWYVAYSLSLRNLEEMMAERGFEVDHSSVHRWVIKLVPLFEKAFRKHKRPVGKSWRMDETYVKVRGQWKYLYRAVDKVSRIGVIEPGMIGIMRPLRMAPKRDFEGIQECGFLPDFATAFSLFSGMGFGLRKLSPSMTMR